MKLKKVTFINFRNFRDKGSIEFNTDEKITLIYGQNGDGKTTLHQLIQWIFYNKVSFNKTSDKNKIYNNRNFRQANVGDDVIVVGEIELIHENDDYSVRREWVYSKDQDGRAIRCEEKDVFTVTKRIGDNWIPLEHPEYIIEDMLPSGLSSYFFFDGETMIADLKEKGKETAEKLKEALFSIFELEYLKKAIEDIGNPRRKESGTVVDYLKKQRDRIRKKNATTQNEKDLIEEKSKNERKIEDNQGLLNSYKKERKDNIIRKDEISEKIGENKSKKELEDDRARYAGEKADLEERIKNDMEEFGKKATNEYAFLLVAKTAMKAKKILGKEVEEEKKKTVPGLQKTLIKELLNSKSCICGSPLGREEKNCLEELLRLFPPESYVSTQNNFINQMERYTVEHNPEKLKSYYKNRVKYNSQIRELTKKINKIDESIKDGTDIDALIEERIEIEKRNKDLDKKIINADANIKIAKSEVKRIEKIIKKQEVASEELDEINKKIDEVYAIAHELEMRLELETKDYMDSLEKSLKQLIKSMLTSERIVELQSNFYLKVVDSYDDEYKSEGQYAVVSFAYIIGILKVLKEYGNLKDKEYPLVLDGPFSKLDEIQRENVVKTLPKYVPQTVILSKESLDNVVDKKYMGNVYTIDTNKEKNEACVIKGEPKWN